MKKDGVQYSGWGENIFLGQGYSFNTADEAAEFFMKGWMNSRDIKLIY